MTTTFPNQDRTAKSTAIHTLLDEAAAGINDSHARVLSSVIEAQAWKIHRDIDGFSGLRDWLCAKFDFHTRTSADLAAIARCARKFTVLAESATTGAARIDLVAAAARRLEATKALRVYAKTAYREPVVSPFDPSVTCPTPEHVISEWCKHATVKEVHARLDEIEAALDSGEEILEGLGQDSLQRLELVELDNGMWALDATLAADTGRLFAKYLTTAVPPPRQEEIDADGVLPAKANRDAEALHQLLAGYGTSPQAATRHGHTATLDLVVDIETLQGKETGRTPLLEGQPVSLARARLLACEGVVIPSVFNYATGEAVELGRAVRLPNTALRRKLELEQPEGCAWTGCDLPIAWTEAHHIVHWADGGDTNAANLILLCRFHHGRIHTAGWTVEKTAPGQAIITHHEGHEPQDDKGADGCGCSDWRTDADMDTENKGSDWDAFPTGLYRSEWSETMKPDLDLVAQEVDRARAVAAMNAAKAKCRAKFTPRSTEANPPEPGQPKQPATDRPADLGDPPFLRCPLRSDRGGEGKARHPPDTDGPRLPARTPRRVRAHPHARQPRPTRTRRPRNPPPRQCDLFVAARPNREHPRTSTPKTRPTPTSCRCPLEA